MYVTRCSIEFSQLHSLKVRGKSLMVELEDHHFNKQVFLTHMTPNSQYQEVDTYYDDMKKFKSVILSQVFDWDIDATESNSSRNYSTDRYTIVNWSQTLTETCH